MAPGDWSQLARALRAEKLEQTAKCNGSTGAKYDAHNTTREVMQALENVAMKIAGGYVHD